MLAALGGGCQPSPHVGTQLVTPPACSFRYEAKAGGDSSSWGDGFVLAVRLDGERRTEGAARPPAGGHTDLGRRRVARLERPWRRWLEPGGLPRRQHQRATSEASAAAVRPRCRLRLPGQARAHIFALHQDARSGSRRRRGNAERCAHPAHHRSRLQGARALAAEHAGAHPARPSSSGHIGHDSLDVAWRGGLRAQGPPPPQERLAGAALVPSTPRAAEDPAPRRRALTLPWRMRRAVHTRRSPEPRPRRPSAGLRVVAADTRRVRRGGLGRACR